MRAQQRNHTNNVQPPNLKIVVVDKDQATIENEIERHVKVIRSLIQKLTPTDRQKYFNGLLAHIIDEPVKTTEAMGKNTRWQRTDYSNLTVRELSLLEELSGKMEQMYRIMEHDDNH